MRKQKVVGVKIDTTFLEGKMAKYTKTEKKSLWLSKSISITQRYMYKGVHWSIICDKKTSTQPKQISIGAGLSYDTFIQFNIMVLLKIGMWW